MRRRLLWILIIGIALAIALVVARHDQDTIAGLAIDDFGSLAYHLALVAFIGGAVLVLFRERLSHALEAALFWVVAGLVLVFIYTYRAELRGIGDRVLSEVMPGRVASRSADTVEIVRGRGGDFQVAAQVNGTRVAMALDTGASAVVLTQEAAKAAGLPLEMLQLYGAGRYRQRPRPCGFDHPRPAGGRRHRRAGRAGADRPARPVARQPSRHELPQPAAKLGGPRRQAFDARQAAGLAHFPVGCISLSIVMPGLVPGIHDFKQSGHVRRAAASIESNG